MSGSEPNEFARIHEDFREQVLAYAARLIGADDAEDVTQEVFLKVDRSLGTLADRSRLGSWIHAITLNTIRDFARRRSVRPEGRAVSGRPGEAGDSPLSGLPDRATRGPEEQAMRDEMVMCYLDFVGRMPGNYHDVFVLSEFQHLAVPDIADRLSLTRGAVKIRLHRARAWLARELRGACRLYDNERGELLGEPVGTGPAAAASVTVPPGRASGRSRSPGAGTGRRTR